MRKRWPKTECRKTALAPPPVITGPATVIAGGFVTGAATVGGGAVVVGAAVVVGVAVDVGLVGYDLYLMNQINDINQQNEQAQPRIQQLQGQVAERKAVKRRGTEPPPPGLSPCELAKWKLQQRKDCYNFRYNYGIKWYNDGFKGHEEEMANLLKAIQNAEEDVKKYCQPTCDNP